MSDFPQSRYDRSEPYEICLKGHLDARWSDWFDGLTISHEDNGNTRLTGPIADQSALHGLLAKIRDLGLPLISLMPVATYQESSHQAATHPNTEETEKTNHEYTSTSSPSTAQSI